MAWDSWEESQRRYEEQRKRVEAERQDRERRLADDRKRANEEQERAKERKKLELNKKAEREEKKRQQAEKANAVYEEVLNGSGDKEKKKSQISLNKFGGMRAFGFSRGGQPSSGSSQQRPTGVQKEEGGATPSRGSGAPSVEGGGTRLMTAAWLSGSRRYR